ncbi:fumarylacetoacetate hydrolase family protein [Vulcanisaeta distributa]|uniref:Fumarylacetoacetate (FAA) hydrolase n=1 Tax=Vulcanisaeta distributa (strain DSM 14429 / JCM 11212 / NBRC 100878 / IC-017) TaxID=572478 RepID=E1QNI1_VULDI|nr:fumarylacetoacetate hydrolase family protein [Vulcanisaeta distributa]ADN51269.1 fumarylacetoacetate (FAA) hydrolase [Vulcanisaeta distributa DSM 14429]
MKLLSYLRDGRVRSAVLFEDNYVVDLNDNCYAMLIDKGEDEQFAERFCNAVLPPDMLGVLQSGDEGLRLINDVIDWVRSHRDIAVVRRASDVRWKAPLTRANMLRDFLAFRGHVEASSRRMGIKVPEEWFKVPTYYKGDPAIFYGHMEDVPWPSYAKTLDFELEVAAITYKKGKDVSKDRAYDLVIGYTIFNDFSVRELEAVELRLLLGPGKSKDFANGLGPWIVTRDELPDIKGLRVYARINGEIWCDTKIEDMQWDFGDMISYVSMSEYVRPGDVFGSGTVSGCTGLDIGRSLRPGDTVELYVERIGTLINRVVR